MKEKSVGLVVAVSVPNKMESLEVRVVLQYRNNFSLERIAPRLYPRCLQVTCHGKLKEGEDFETALLREMNEELGPDFAENYNNGYRGDEIYRLSSKEKEIVTFATLMPIELIRECVRLDPDTGGLAYITADQVDDIVTASPEMKLTGPEYNCTMAMFPDEIQAVKNTFNLFR